MTETSEEAVVSKTARVPEEVSLRKEASDRVETVRDTVRRDEVEIEQVPGGQISHWSDDRDGSGSAENSRPTRPENLTVLLRLGCRRHPRQHCLTTPPRPANSNCAAATPRSKSWLSDNPSPAMRRSRIIQPATWKGNAMSIIGWWLIF